MKVRGNLFKEGGTRPTPLQRAMYHRSLERVSSGLYVYQLIWQAKRPVCVERVRAAWVLVARRHEALRACFIPEKDREPVVYFDDCLAADQIQVVRVPHECDLNEFLAVDKARGFDFAKPPLWRITILTSGSLDLLVWTYHHIIFDAPSRAMIFKDWRRALSAIEAAEVPKFDDIQGPSFSEYLSELQTLDKARSRAFWQKELAGFVGGTALPSRPVKQNAAPSPSAFEELKIKDVAVLSAGARLHGTTLNAVVQGAWALTLARYNNIQDVTFGSIRAGRHIPGKAKNTSAGMFITSVPFRVNTDTSRSVGQWLSDLARHQTEIRVGEFSSPAEIRAWAGVPQKLPLFQTVLNFHQVSADSGRVSSDDLINFRNAEGVVLEAEASRDLSLVLEYPRHEYDRAHIRTVLEYVRSLIIALTQCPSDKIIAVLLETILSSESQIAGEPAAISVSFDRGRSVVEFFLDAVNRRPNHPAICHGSREISFVELDKQSDRWADFLRGALSKEEPVALVLNRSIEFVIGALSILKAGGSYLPLDPQTPRRQLLQRLIKSGAKWALSASDLGLALEEWPGKIIAIDKEVPANNASAAWSPLIHSDPNRRAYIIATSGSTGVPKLVEVEHHSLTNLISHYKHALQLRDADRISWMSPPAFDASVADIWPGLCSGATVIIPAKQYNSDPDDLINWIQCHEITVAFVPTQLAELLLRRKWPTPLKLRYLGTGGDVLHARPQDGLPFKVINAYGPTENTVDATWSVVQPGPESDRPTIGRPITNVTAHILDQHRRIVPAGEIGELYLGGEQVARGYLNDPQLTKSRFIADPFSGGQGRLYRTGDVARLNDTNEIEFLGRQDLQVQIGGYRIELEEIESVLFRHSSVIEVCCTPVGDGILTRSLIAHVAIKDAADSDAISNLRDFLRSELPPYMIPSKFIAYTQLPHTYADKVDRAALAAGVPIQTEESRNEFDRPYESELRSLWFDLLPESAPDSQGDVDFWQSGGDSLKLIQLALGVEECTGRRLSLPVFLNAPTLRKLQNALEGDFDDKSTGNRVIERIDFVGESLRYPDRRLSEHSQVDDDSLPLYFMYPEPNVIRMMQLIDPEIPVFSISIPWPASWRLSVEQNVPSAIPTIPQMAAHITAVLSTQLNQSRFALAGHSIMGVLAFEVARQLRALDANIEAVILIDSKLKHPPRIYAEWKELKARWRRRIQTLRIVWRNTLDACERGASFGRRLESGIKMFVWLFVNAMRLSLRSIRLHLTSLFKPSETKVLLTTIFDDEGSQLEWPVVDKLYKSAETSYSGGCLDSRGVLIRVKPENDGFEENYDNALDWSHRFKKGLETITILGDHHSIIHDELLRAELSHKITDVIEKIRKSTPSSTAKAAH